MKLNAYAKINITLDVLRRREDGYHDLCGIMHEISLCDELEMQRAAGMSVAFDAPVPEDNTVSRAAAAFMRATGAEGAAITVKKRIPAQAGLGGGSADAAAALLGLNALYGGPLAGEELFRIGAAIGADVPFCMLGGCALAEGVGERLTPLPAVSVPLLVVKGEGGVSTAALFSSLTLPVEHPDNASALRAARACDGAALLRLAKNALEPAASALLPEIASLRRRMDEAGAFASFMTGSGAAVVGAFASADEALRARGRFEDVAFAEACCTRGA